MPCLLPAFKPCVSCGHYAAFFMNSDFAKASVLGMQVGVAQQHFNVGAMSVMPIPFPVPGFPSPTNRLMINPVIELAPAPTVRP